MTASTRNYQHVEFDQMTCPFEDCDVTGAVPGVKRHSKLVHGEAFYQSVQWPALRSVDGPASKQSLGELTAAAINRGLLGDGVPAKKVTKANLLTALVTGQKIA